jgi:hypothetical protein
VFVELSQKRELWRVWLISYQQSPRIKKQGFAHKEWRSSTLVYFYRLVVMPNMIKEMNCGCALLSQVRMHTRRRRK